MECVIQISRPAKAKVVLRMLRVVEKKILKIKIRWSSWWEGDMSLVHPYQNVFAQEIVSLSSMLCYRFVKEESLAWNNR